jgi:hypothetical protein
MVRIDTPGVSGAEIRLNGEPLGFAPVKKKLSDALWESYTVDVRKDGYKTYYGELKKEVKADAVIGGLFVWPIWLWVYGPEPVQNIYLEPEDKK